MVLRKRDLGGGLTNPVPAEPFCWPRSEFCWPRSEDGPPVSSMVLPGPEKAFFCPEDLLSWISNSEPLGLCKGI